MRFISTIILSFFFSVLFGQQINTEFGKNRIQFQEFEWIEHETDNFVFYWYGGGKAIGSYASILTEESYEEIKTILQYRIRTKIHVIVYNDLSDLKQSNIGNDPTFQNTGGVTKIEGNKMFVYFNGDHHDLKVQIRKGISKILVNNLLFGQNVREVVQNALLLDLPSWFLESAVEYIGEPWTIEKDNEFRKIIENEDVNSFSDALYQDGVLSGQALWNYIVKTNGTSAFANILYVTRTNRSLNQGFQYATSKTISKTSKEVFEYYKKGYTEDLENRQESPIALDINYKKRSDINRGALHPTLPIIAYSTNEEDQKKVFLYNYKTNKHSKVAKAGFKNPFQEIDFKYPLLDWSPSGEYLAIVFEKKDNLYLRIYDYRKKGTFDIKIENAFSRWLSIDFYDDNNIAVTADKKGQSDVFIYDLRNRKPRQLTSDLYDDKDATHVTIGDKKGIVFSSNRNTTSLEKKTLNEVYPILNQYDLYFLDLANNKKLYRLTNTPSVNETLPKSSGDSEILFLSDEVGIQNKFKGSINALEDDILFSSSQVTNFGYATDYFDYSPSTNISLDIGGNTKALQLFIDTLESAPHIGEKTFFLSSNEDVIELKESEEDIFFQKKKEPEPADSNKVFFYTPFDNDEDESVTAETEEVEEIELEAGEIETSGINNASSNEAFKKFKSGKTIAHRRKFRMVGLTTQLDNAPLVEGFTAFQASSFIPNESEFSANLALPITTLKFELDVRDLFEDYRINAGIRIPVNLGGIDYFVSFSDLRKRIDKKISLYRTKRSQNAFFEPGLPEDEIDVKYISTHSVISTKYLSLNLE